MIMGHLLRSYCNFDNILIYCVAPISLKELKLLFSFHVKLQGLRGKTQLYNKLVKYK